MRRWRDEAMSLLMAVAVADGSVHQVRHRLPDVCVHRSVDEGVDAGV